MEILAITIPIFIFVAAGYLASKRGLIGEETKNFLSKTVYYFAFPALTFRSILQFKFSETFDKNLIIQNMLVTTIIAVLTFLLAFLIRTRYKRGAFNMSSFRSNQGYMGLPITKGFYGDEGMSKSAVVNGFDTLLVTFLSVIFLEVFRGKKAKESSLDMANSKSKTAQQVIIERLLSFIINPFILSAILGLLFSKLGIKVLNFTILDKFLEIASGMALPLALLLIGCSIKVGNLLSNLKLVLFASGFKLIAAPIIAFILGYYVFGFTGVRLGVSVILPATPSAVSAYVFASEMDTDEELTASIIGFTTFVSVLTISIIQFALKSFFI
jgi:malate permease and related proteins